MRPFNTQQNRDHNDGNNHQGGGGSAKPIRNSNLLDKKHTQQHDKTTVKQLAILEDLEEILYLDVQNSAENRPSVSGNLFLHEQIMLQGKHSEGTATARKPVKSRGENHRLVSATCRYSSWERAYYDIRDQDEDADSIVDSLSRLFDQSISDNDDDQKAG